MYFFHSSRFKKFEPSRVLTNHVYYVFNIMNYELFLSFVDGFAIGLIELKIGHHAHYFAIYRNAYGRRNGMSLKERWFQKKKTANEELI